MTALANSSRKPLANPHLIAGLALAIAVFGAAAAALLLGDPNGAAPRAVAPVPPAERVQLAEARPAQPEGGLRGDRPGLDDPMLDLLAPPPAESADIMLPGVAEIDEDAPVRTSAELEAEARVAARTGLAEAPIDGLTEPGPGGLLPVIGANGQRPADAYARPFKDDGLPRIALIVGGLGWDADTTRRAIRDLPPEVTLGFSPEAPNLQTWIDSARESGHEVIIEIPMEPFDYPEINDPGEHTLLTTIGASGNINRLEWLLSRATGYFAVMNYFGEQFFTSEPAMDPVLSALAARGVDLIYDGARARPAIDRIAGRTGLQWASTDRALDAFLSADEVTGQLSQLETLSLQNGSAMGAGFAYPVVVDQVAAWAEGVERRGYALAPASAVLAAKAESRE